MHIVNVPVADIFRTPDGKDLETQALQGECVTVLEEKEGWLRIEAIEQRFFNGQFWQGYPGWLKANQLKCLDRTALITRGRQFLGVPYLWGGRNPTGFDCSGLVSFLYHEQGFQIPRDAHDQFLASHPCETLLPGDIVCMKPDKSDRMDHVMLYAGDDLLLEATRRSHNVRIIPFTEREVDGYQLYFRRF